MKKNLILGLVIGLLLCVSLASADVVINEFVVDPQIDWDESGTIGAADEWFELYNPTMDDINITDWNLSLTDNTNTEIELLVGVIPSNGRFVILNPSGSQNNDGNGILILYNTSGSIIDKVAYGNYNDGNTSNNAPNGDADNSSNECLFRIHDGIDTNIDSDDFKKGPCTFNAINNRLPTGNIGNQETDEDVPDYFIITTINDPDGDALTFTIADEHVNEVNCEIINETNVTMTPASNWNGVANCTVGIDDGYVIVHKLFYITVNEDNDAPVVDLSSLDGISLDEDSYDDTINLSGYVTDVDNADEELAWVCSSNETDIIVSVDNAKILNISAVNNFYGAGNITCTASDLGYPDEDSFIVDVESVNDLPVVDSIGLVVFNEEEYNSNVDLDGYVYDVETADEDISWSVGGNTANLIIDIDEETHVLNISASKDWYGDRTIILTATDGDDGSASVNVNVTVANVNDKPYFTSTPSLTAIEAVQYAYDANAYDIDSNVSKLEFSIVTAPTDATIDSPTGEFKWIPSAAQVGINNVKLEVKDPEGDSTTQEFNITVLPVLDITDILVNGESLEDRGGAAGLAPGDFIAVQYKVKNRFPAGPNKAIVGIETSAEIDDYLIEKSTSGFFLEGQETKLINYNFQLPYTANIENFDVEISVGGIDLYDNLYSSSKTIDLVLDRDFHRVEITGKEWLKDNVSCLRDNQLMVTIVNTGNWSEEGTVNVYNKVANKNETKSFSLGIAEDVALAFDVDASAAVSNELFDITVKYRYNYYTIEDSIELVVGDCLDTVALNAVLKVNESEQPIWSEINLSDYILSDDSGLSYAILGENEDLIDCDVTLGGIFSCGTPLDDLFGISVINMSIGDVYEQFSVTVLSKNDKPIAYDVSASVDEDKSTVIKLNCSDVDGDLLSYIIVDGPNNGALSGSGNSRTYVPNSNYNGLDSFSYKCNDGIVDSNNSTASIMVIPQLDKPFIDGFNPLDTAFKVGDNFNIRLNVSVVNPDGIAYEVNWYVNDVKEGDNTLTFDFSRLDKGTYTVTAKLQNITEDELYDTQSWIIGVSTIPIADTFDGVTTDFEGLSDTELESMHNLTLEKTAYGKIEFLEALDMRNVVDLDRYVRIEKGVAGIDSDALGFGGFKGKSARITLYNLPFTEKQKIYYNAGFFTSGAAECTSCNILGYNATTGRLMFEVDGFSIFWVNINLPPKITSSPVTTAILGEPYSYDVEANDPESDALTYSLTAKPTGMTIDSSTGLISWASANVSDESVTVKVTDTASNTDTQSFTISVRESAKLIISDLDIKVGDKTEKDLKDGDTIGKEASPGDRVKFDVELENLFSSSSDIQIEDIEVTVTIEGIDDGDDLEESVDVGDLDAGDDDSVTLEFDIPTLVDEDTYDVTIEVDGEDEKGNNQDVRWELKLNVEKEKHALLIDTADLSPSVIRCDGSPSLAIEVVNIGTEDEDDVTIEATNDEIGLNIEENGIELEEGNDEDSVFEKVYSLKIDDDVKPGTYQIAVRAYYDSKKSDEETIDLVVEKCTTGGITTPVKGEPADLITITPTAAKPAAPSTKISFRESSEYLTLLAILCVILVGALIFAIGAVIITARKRRE